MNIKYEYMKLKKYKILVFILCFLCLLKVFEMSQMPNHSPFSNPHSEKYYQAYIDEYQGTLDESRRLEIEKEKEQFQLSENAINEVSQKRIYLQKFDDNDIQIVKDNLENSVHNLDKKEAFDYFYNQVEYALENPKQNIIFDYRGWQSLLEDEYVDIMLIVALIFINGFIFVVDYEEGTYPLLSTTTKGRTGIIKNKMKLGIVISLIFIIGFSLMNEMHYFMNYSFEYGNTVMQSIPLFKNAPYPLTLSSAFMMVRILRLIGYLLVMTITWILIIIFKHFMVASFVHIGSYVLLGSLISHEYLYRFINPLSLIMGSGMIRGNEYRILNRNTHSAMEIQTFIMDKHIILWLSLVIFISIIGYILRKCYLRYTYQSSGKRLHLTAILICCLLVGCQSQDVNTDGEYRKQNYIWNNDSLVFMNNSDLFSYDESFQLSRYIKDPAFEIDGDIQSFYKEGNHLYFWVSQDNNTYQIYDYNSEIRKVKLIYNKDGHSFTNVFNLFQTDYSFIDESIHDTQIMQFYIFKDYLLYSDNNYLFLENMSTHKKEMLFSLNNSEIAFVKNKIYYCNDRMDLSCFDLDTRQSEVISKDFIYQIYQYHDSIYYTQSADEGIYSFDGEKIKKEIKQSYFIYAASQDMIYYKDATDLVIYDINTKQTNRIKNQNIYDISIINDDRIMVTQGNGNDVDIFIADKYLTAKNKIPQ